MTHALGAPGSLGQYLSQLLAERKESWSELSFATGLSEIILEELAAGKKILTGDIAIMLADHFGTSPIVLLGVQCRYYLSRSEDAAHAALAAA